jgi:hypothetical protein
VVLGTLGERRLGPDLRPDRRWRWPGVTGDLPVTLCASRQICRRGDLRDDPARNRGRPNFAARLPCGKRGDLDCVGLQSTQVLGMADGWRQLLGESASGFRNAFFHRDFLVSGEKNPLARSNVVSWPVPQSTDRVIIALSSSLRHRVQAWKQWPRARLRVGSRGRDHVLRMPSTGACTFLSPADPADKSTRRRGVLVRGGFSPRQRTVVDPFDGCPVEPRTQHEFGSCPRPGSCKRQERRKPLSSTEAASACRRWQ